MRVLKKAIAGLLLLIGVPIVMLTSIDIINPESTQEEKSNAIAALVILGIPPTVVGTWLAGGLHTNARRQERDRFRTTFFNLVKQGQGKISAFDFAEATGLSGDRARLYLDERARTFNATFHVDDQGGIFYLFTLGYSDAQRLLNNATPHPLEDLQSQAFTDLPRPVSDFDSDGQEIPDSEQFSEEFVGDRQTPSQTHSEEAAEESADDSSTRLSFDILLKTVPGDRQAEIQQLVQVFGPHDAKIAANLLTEPLSIVATGLDQATAERYRHQLEAAGAAVLVVLPPPEAISALTSPPRDTVS